MNVNDSRALGLGRSRFRPMKCYCSNRNILFCDLSKSCSYCFNIKEFMRVLE